MVRGFMKYQMERLDEKACAILKYALAYGDILIVTNAASSWVEESARKYLPRTGAFIAKKGIRVSSARDMYKKHCPNDPTKWKVCTFIKELTRLHSSTENLNLFVVGDSLSDLIAAHEAFDSSLGTDLKMVKFVETPTVAELIVQLRTLEQNLDYLASLSFSFDVGLLNPSVDVRT